MNEALQAAKKPTKRKFRACVSSGSESDESSDDEEELWDGICQRWLYIYITQLVNTPFVYFIF